MNFIQKIQWTHISISPLEWSWGARKIDMFQILCSTEMEKKIRFWAKGCRNYRLYQKIVQIKIVQNWISHKKVSGRVCLSLPSVAKGLQRLICLKYHNVLKWETLFQYNIIFETYHSIESPSSTPGRDWHVHPLTFLYEI